MSEDRSVGASDDLTGQLVTHLRTRIDQAPSAAPDVVEVESRGQRRRTRRRVTTGIVASVAMVMVLAGVGLTARSSSGRELAASLEQTELVPFAVSLRAEGQFVGLAYLPQDEAGRRVSMRPDDPLTRVVLIESNDGLQWSRIEGSVLDLAGTSGVGRPQAVGFALRGDTAVLATASEDERHRDRPEDAATLRLVTAEFDLSAEAGSREWLEADADLPVTLEAQERVIAVEVGTTADGVLANLTLLTDPFEAGLERLSLGWTQVCGVASNTPMSVAIRRCGSTEITEVDLGPGSTPRTLTVYVTEDGVSEVRGLGVTSFWEHQVYQTSDGVGLVTDAMGETTDGRNWMVPWEPVGTVAGVAAYGDRRIAVERHIAAPLGPGRPFRGVWISDSAEPNEVRQHQVVAGESGTHIAADYGIGLDDLIAANPEIEPDAFGDTAALDADTSLVIPDIDPTRRGWRSIDLRPAIGSATATSHWMFHQVAAGSGGFVVALRELSTERVTSENLLETEPFRVVGPQGTIEGSTPFGPATVRDLDGRIVAQWDHFEAEHPFDMASIIDSIDGPMVAIEVGGSDEVHFPADEWFEATRRPGPPTTLLIGSVDGVEWRELGRYSASTELKVIDDVAVYISSWEGIIERVELTEPTE